MDLQLIGRLVFPFFLPGKTGKLERAACGLMLSVCADLPPSPPRIASSD